LLALAIRLSTRSRRCAQPSGLLAAAARRRRRRDTDLRQPGRRWLVSVSGCSAAGGGAAGAVLRAEQAGRRPIVKLALFRRKPLLFVRSPGDAYASPPRPQLIPLIAMTPSVGALRLG